jgi:hypothetical protein
MCLFSVQYYAVYYVLKFRSCLFIYIYHFIIFTHVYFHLTSYLFYVPCFVSLYNVRTCKPLR